MANPKVEVEIVATDEATPKIVKLEKRIDGLESDEARITITAETKKLDQQLTDALAKMAKLDGDELTVQARLVGTLEDDLRQATDLLEQLDGKTGTVTITADTTGLTAGAERASEGIDGVSKSGQAANSVLANMVGNATQDLGQLGGVAGSAGVAIGQMAERIADARAEGAGISTIATSFGTVLGPIAALSIGIQLITSHIQKAKEREKELQQQTEAVTDALIDAQDAGQSFVDTLSGLGDVEIQNILKGLKPEELDAFGLAIKSLGLDYTDLVNDFKDETPGAVQATRALGDQITDTFNAVEAASTTNRSNASIWEEVGKQYGLTGEQARQLNFDIATLNEVVGQQLDQQETAIAQGKVVADLRGDYITDTEAMTAATQEWVKANKPLEDMPETWQTAIRAMNGLRNGQQLTAAQTQAITVLMQQYGLTTEEVLDRASDLYDQQFESASHVATAQELINQSIEDSKKNLPTLDEYRKKWLANKTAIADVNSEMLDLVQNQNDVQADALADALDAGNGPLDTLTNLQKINQSFRDLADFIDKDLKGAIPDIFNADDVNADDFLNKLDSIKGPIQAAITEAFREGGTGAATALAQQFITKLATETGLSASTISTLLGLDDLEAEIDLSIRVSEFDKAKAQLDFLQRLLEIFPGATFEDQVWVINMAMALDTESIDPVHAQSLIQERMRRVPGVEIPTELEAPDTDKALADAQRDFDSKEPIIIPTRLQAQQLDRALGQAGIPSFNFATGQSTNVGSPTPTTTVNQTINMAPGSPDFTFGQYSIFTSRNGVDR